MDDPFLLKNQLTTWTDPVVRLFLGCEAFHGPCNTR